MRTQTLYRIVSWAGVGFFVFGTIGSMFSIVTFVQVRTGWGLTEAEACCSELGKASLGGALASMFFVLIGSAVLLLLHPIRARRAREAGRTPPRWLRWLAVLMVAYSVGVFGLATAIAGMAEDLEGFAVGIVSYCMLVGVGMLAAAWGFKRASELPLEEDFR